MSLIASEAELAKAAKYLATPDPVLAPVITQYRPCTIRPHKDYYQELVDSIISQQLSVHAARTILTTSTKGDKTVTKVIRVFAAKAISFRAAQTPM